MGIAIAADLAQRDDTAGVVVVDREASALAEAETACEAAGVPRRALRVARHALEDGPALQALLRAADVAVSAVPYEHNPRLTDLAIEQGTHLIDLGGNPGIVRLQGRRADTARQAGVAVVPDCGLAPGLANVIAGHEIRAAGTPEFAHIRVGGLPQRPSGPLGYALLFSVHGLINEYREPAQALRGGRAVWLKSLDDVEEIHFAGLPLLEAFNTSGGTGTMCETFAGRLGDLDYKTIRYPGHAERVRMLFDLGLFEPVAVAPGLSRRDVSEAALAEALGGAVADMTLLRVDVRASDLEGGRVLRRTEIVDRHDGRWTSMQRMTGWPAAATAWLLASGQVAARGVLRGESDIPWPPMREALAARGIRATVTSEPVGP